MMKPRINSQLTTRIHTRCLEKKETSKITSTLTRTSPAPGAVLPVYLMTIIARPGQRRSLCPSPTMSPQCWDAGAWPKPQLTEEKSVSGKSEAQGTKTEQQQMIT